MAPCHGVRDHDPVTNERSGTKDYSQEARDRLAGAVIAAREHGGWKSRPAFVAAFEEVTKKSLDLLERGEPGVGARYLRAIGRALPNWTQNTPHAILEGEEPPPLLSKAVTDTEEDDLVAGPGELPDYSHLSPDERRRIIRRSIDQLQYTLPLGQGVYEVNRESLIRLIVKYEPREGDD